MGWGVLRREGTYPWSKKKSKNIDPIISGDGFPPDFVPPVVPTLHFDDTKRVLHKRQIVMLAEPCCDEDVVYINDDRDLSWRMVMDEFRDMGSPMAITLTITPGDTLNKEK